jgi:hypothetical protein
LLVWLAFEGLGGWPLNDDPYYAKPLFNWFSQGQWTPVKQKGELTASSLAHLARWQYVNSQLAAGMRADAIDGGRDVNAWLRLDEDANSMPREGDTSPWWSGRATRALAVGHRPGWHEIDRLTWSAWATGRKHDLLILERVQLSKP